MYKKSFHPSYSHSGNFLESMSGYRSLHRQQIVVPEQQKQEEPPQNEPIAIWDIETTCLLLNPSAQRQRNSNRNCWRIWIATSDGYIRTYKVHEKTINDTASSSSLDASALSLQCTHILKSRTHPNSDSGLFGCTRITTIRNYIGTDNNDGVGNLIMASIDLIGTIRIWNFDENWDDTTGNNDKNPMEEPKTIQAMHEFKTVPNATGTMAQLVILASSPNNIIGDVVMIAVGCLDGTIVFVSTGISVYKGAASEPENETNTAPGTIME